LTIRTRLCLAALFMPPHQFLLRRFLDDSDCGFAKFQSVAVACADYISFEAIIADHFTKCLQPRCGKSRPLATVRRESIQHVDSDPVADKSAHLCRNLAALLWAALDDVRYQLPHLGIVGMLADSFIRQN
jgi:hypothetical protein